MERFLTKVRHGAGGFQLQLTADPQKDNTRFSKSKKNEIIRAMQDIWTEGIYYMQGKQVKRQLLNGSAQYLKKDQGTGDYYFS